MKFHPGQVSKLFYDFENKYFEKLKNVNFWGWNTWRIIKSSLYLDSVYINSKETGSKESPKVKLVWPAIKSFFVIIRFFIFWLKPQKRITVIITHTVNKTLKDQLGFSYDQIIDGLIVESEIENYLYIEVPGLPKESLVKPKIAAHFNEGDFRFIKIIIHKLLVSRRVEGASVELITSLFNEELKGSGFTTSKERLSHSISGFGTDYIFYSWLFKLLKPKLLITNDLMGTGIIAAARSHQIQSFELQHGLMDEYYPQYQMHPKFVSIKKQLPIADRVGVFGQFHKDQLVSKGFWRNDEVIVVGKFELPIKNNSIVRFSDKPTLLFATQGSLFYDQSILFLKSLLDNAFTGFQLVIKLHPLEPEYCKDGYQKLGSENNRVTLVQNQFNLSELFSVSNFVMSYNSTVLIEAVAKGVFSFTVCDDVMKNGIYDLIGENPVLEKFLVKVNNVEEIIGYVQNRDIIARSKEFQSVSNYLYEASYKTDFIKLNLK